MTRADDQSAHMPNEILDHGRLIRRQKGLNLPTHASRISTAFRILPGLVAALGGPVDLVLQTLQERSAVINHRHRITGDAVTWIIEEVIAMKGKIKIDGLQEAPTPSSTRRSSYPESGVLFQCPT